MRWESGISHWRSNGQMKRIAGLGDHLDLFILKFGGEVDLWFETVSFLQLDDLVAERHGTSSARIDDKELLLNPDRTHLSPT